MLRQVFPVIWFDENENNICKNRETSVKIKEFSEGRFILCHLSNIKRLYWSHLKYKIICSNNGTKLSLLK